MSDELVFTVDGASAVPAQPISLDEAGLREREHLQEWVISHPGILGPGVMIVAFEFAQWQSRTGPEFDRLDVLGLDQSGHLVVAELKRGHAPDTVEMQAIKYAAMTSRFTTETLASAHASFLSSRGESVREEEALERLSAHCEFGLTAETLSRPRIVLVASSYAPIVTQTTVWLTEMGLDITLIQFQAYRTSTGVLVTVSQLYPVRDVEEFVVAPRQASARATAAEYPHEDWTAGDFHHLAEIATNPTILAALNMLSLRPGEPISLREIEAAAGRTTNQAKGDLAGLTMMVKRRFGRGNWPFRYQWAAGGEPQAYYVMDTQNAGLWREAVAQIDAPPAPIAQ